MTRRQITGLIVLCLTVFMVAVDGTVVSVAVPSITEQLRPDYNQVLWIGGIYSFVRAAQGVTGAGLMPSTLALLRSLFSDEGQRMRAVGVWSAAGAAGAAWARRWPACFWSTSIGAQCFWSIFRWSR